MLKQSTWKVPLDVSRKVHQILFDIEERGDDAVIEWTCKLDQRQISNPDALKVDAELMAESLQTLDSEVKGALELAYQRIKAYHFAERAERNSWRTQDSLGVIQGRIIRSVRSAGCYIPGGTASYPSSVLMNLAPASVAGVPNTIICSPWPQGKYSASVLAAAQIADCHNIYSIGGAVAIGAMAFGTESIPAVDIVTGPGNIWVAEAKRQVFGRVGIDLLAGPSEILIIADETARPDWVAADLCSQAEHDPSARPILISTSAELTAAVQNRLKEFIPDLERKETICASLTDQGAAITVNNLEAAAEIANQLAPEHLQLAIQKPQELLPSIQYAGAVFLGHASAEVFGDYTAGSNHILPTGGTARFSQSLSVSTFLTEMAFIECPPPASRKLSRPTEILAREEQLTAHALAARLRLDET
ncbi:MAG: histidinol dehydrogenase [Gammaproteobacteria bacterium]